METNALLGIVRAFVHGPFDVGLAQQLLEGLSSLEDPDGRKVCQDLLSRYVNDLLGAADLLKELQVALDAEEEEAEENLAETVAALHAELEGTRGQLIAGRYDSIEQRRRIDALSQENAMLRDLITTAMGKAQAHQEPAPLKPRSWKEDAYSKQYSDNCISYHNSYETL